MLWNVFVMGLPMIFVLFLLTGRAPWQHPAHHPGDPQRGGRQRGNHESGRPAELSHIRDVGDPVPQAEHSRAGAECAGKTRSPSPPFLTAQDQNSRPDGREHHRPMVANAIPWRILPLQPHLLALLCQLERGGRAKDWLSVFCCFENCFNHSFLLFFFSFTLHFLQLKLTFLAEQGHSCESTLRTFFYMQELTFGGLLTPGFHKTGWVYI